MVSRANRVGERIPILGHLGGDITVVEPLAVKELGMRGATIETRFPLVIDTLHEMRLDLAGTPVVVKGRVVHAYVGDIDTESVAYVSGLEFVDLPAHVERALDRYLTDLKAARAAAATTGSV